MTLDSADERVVFDLSWIGRIGSAADGTIFVFADSGFYRSAPGGQLPFERLSDLKPQGATGDFDVPGSWVWDVYAPSRDAVFIAAGSVWRWEETSGWKRVAAGRKITREQMMRRCDDCFWGSDRAGIRSIWGRHAADVYAVGGFASIIHFDGESWREIENPLVSLVDSSYSAGMDSPEITSVGGNEQSVYAVTVFHLLRDQGNGWEVVERPDNEAWEFCGLRSVAATENAAWVAGGARSCVARFKDDEWHLLANGNVRGFDYPLYAESAPDGSIVFHTPHTSPFLVVRDGRITGFLVTSAPYPYDGGYFNYGAGVALTDEYVFVATRLRLLRYPRS